MMDKHDSYYSNNLLLYNFGSINDNNSKRDSGVLILCENFDLRAIEKTYSMFIKRKIW